MSDTNGSQITGLVTQVTQVTHPFSPDHQRTFRSVVGGLKISEWSLPKPICDMSDLCDNKGKEAAESRHTTFRGAPELCDLCDSRPLTTGTSPLPSPLALLLGARSAGKASS
jgi:hypothetical protein